jgi:hypothetical protein
MIPVSFPEANCKFGPPPDLAESQCMTIHAYRGKVVGGSVDGSDIVVVAWKPGADELKQLVAGKPVLLSMTGGLVPHFLTTNFNQATHPL